LRATFFAGAFLLACFDGAWCAAVLLMDAFLAVSATTVTSDLSSGDEALDQLVLTSSGLILADLARIAQSADLVELGPDGRWVVVDILGLPAHLLCNRHHSTQRGDRQGEEPGEKSHYGLPTKS
jgi:hypothetical protein